MITLIVSAAVAILACAGGAYLGYRYGSQAAAKVAKVVAAVDSIKE